MSEKPNQSYLGREAAGEPVYDVAGLPSADFKVHMADYSVDVGGRRYLLPKECARDFVVRLYIRPSGPPLVETLAGVRPLVELEG